MKKFYGVLLATVMMFSLVLVGCNVSTDTGKESEKVTEGGEKVSDESLEEKRSN